ncbi:MarR family transcriptional regulator [Methanosarcina sp. 2.H.T.1A.6]|uniref:MarR family winged helix-turn-helix transcriptional regulator n=1 Tax=unclassified Methanosarcina TaxID=2644672 RepID=UPI00062217CC|nr:MULTISPECIES: MarR family transcriptional regulator [unclassified Methanosarcina]KKG15591.1 MarR family transcriptional regulator [Methanosarcina sp. 2.H.T.1A.15]KKG17594.1 MarR family transcriptional regulator [Methanosarcina sp. 2.H.T.1A.3]KKG21834.1 MarR family transcriptional regulator [Methanosarcina sp. 2.H.T.1A.6]KKG25369.1 MarR family transcriptional regulator [Methanosarcina sp. 2.H.T.1A.8]
MKEEIIKETVKLQFEMIHLFHKNFAKTFHQAGNSPYSLNKNQNKAILIIGSVGEIMPTTLGKCLDLQKGSLTSMIDALEREELVFRKGDPGDRRKTLISLTEKGKVYRDWFTEELEKSVSEVLNRLAEEDIAAYKESLKTMLGTLKELDGST